MNLLQEIQLLRDGSITAGGPGSGCSGPNCGRPKGFEGYRIPSYKTAIRQQPLNANEKEALKNYSMSTSVNVWLNEDKTNPLFEKQLANLDSAIQKGTLTSDSVLYRYPRGNLAAYRTATPGQVIPNKGYQSTSTDLKGLNYFKDKSTVLLQIHAPAGTHASYGGETSAGAAAEKEIILPRGSSFKVLNVSEPNKDG